MGLVEERLNRVQSVGEELAVLSAAMAAGNTAILSYGYAKGDALLDAAVPDVSGDLDTIVVLEGALAGETNLLASATLTDPVDSDQWARARDEVTRLYVTASGVEGVASGVEAALADVPQILDDAIANAPHVVRAALAGAAAAAGQAVGFSLDTVFATVWAFLKPIWPYVLLAGVLLLFVLVPGLGALAVALARKLVASATTAVAT